MSSQDNRLWLNMWRNRQTDGFHQLKVNKYLARFWPRLELAKGMRVFVPLCGKSLDMIWLASQGCEVIGVELSPIAVEAFFKENHLQPVRRRMGSFTLWQHGRISILCGDYFALTKADLGHIDTVYDRAALTALPEAARKLYVAHLQRIISIMTNVFLLTIEDEAAEQIDDELVSLYAGEFDIRLEFMEEGEESEEKIRSEYKVYRLVSRE